jgi:hypothetical protein
LRIVIISFQYVFFIPTGFGLEHVLNCKWGCLSSSENQCTLVIKFQSYLFFNSEFKIIKLLSSNNISCMSYLFQPEPASQTAILFLKLHPWMQVLILNTYEYLCTLLRAGFVCCIYFTVLIWYAFLPNNKYIYIFMQFSSYFAVPFPYTKSHTQHGVVSVLQCFQYLYYDVEDDWGIWIGKDFKRGSHGLIKILSQQWPGGTK